MSKTKTPAPCPCGGPSLATCCGPYLDGASLPASAELLMRSRYTAYTLKDEPYLLATWYPRTRPTERIIDPNETLQWLGLEVKSALRLRQRKVTNPASSPATDAATGPDEDYVEFVARFRVNGKAHRLHEVSRFLREPDPALGGTPRWFYVDGDFPTRG